VSSWDYGVRSQVSEEYWEKIWAGLCHCGRPAMTDSVLCYSCEEVESKARQEEVLRLFEEI